MLGSGRLFGDSAILCWVGELIDARCLAFSFSADGEPDGEGKTDDRSIFLNFSTIDDQELPCIATAVITTRHASIVKARIAVVIGDCIAFPVFSGGYDN